jgi:acyl carrier protein
MIEDTIEQLRRLVAERLDINRTLAEITADAPLLGGGLGLDSLAIVELISLTEEAFEIEFGEDQLNMESFASLSALAAVVMDLRAQVPQPAE